MGSRMNITPAVGTREMAAEDIDLVGGGRTWLQDLLCPILYIAFGYEGRGCYRPGRYDEL
jgi:hypothetical protein